VPTSERSRQRTKPAKAAASESAADAVARARSHAQSAIAEALAAVRALLDASSLALSGKASASSALLGPIARILEGLEAEFDGAAANAETSALLGSIADALDAEVARWQARAETDPEARAVLRAFLGLRELLWEFGIRREPEASRGDTRAPRSARKAGRATSKPHKRPRIQRVTVEG